MQVFLRCTYEEANVGETFLGYVHVTFSTYKVKMLKPTEVDLNL